MYSSAQGQDLDSVQPTLDIHKQNSVEQPEASSLEKEGSNLEKSFNKS